MNVLAKFERLEINNIRWIQPQNLMQLLLRIDLLRPLPSTNDPSSYNLLTNVIPYHQTVGIISGRIEPNSWSNPHVRFRSAASSDHFSNKRFFELSELIL